MVHRRKIRMLIFVALLSVVPLIIMACAPAAVMQTEQDKVKQQLSAERPGVTILLGAQKPPPPPPPPPSPPPAARPPAFTTPASYYEPVGPFFFYVETVASANTRYGVASTLACVQSGVFKRGMRLVFRFEILDTSTGKRVTDKDGATVKVRLPHGEELATRWAIRGGPGAVPDSAWMWVAVWDIPPDYPVGSLDYRIGVNAKDGRAATFIPPIQKTKTSDSRLRIVD